ncbi:hypothetical protein ACVWWR_006615 [Bradyrhizobium sp. LM3.2]
MPNRLETHRVVAYNTAKQSENKMHDDNVARRFGFSGGLVPGVDVVAYMMHVPVARWGRDFLSRGLVEARFIKPVYDGETADVDATEHNGLLTIEVFSRTELCATGTATLPAAAATAVSLSEYIAVPVVAERKPVSAATFETGNWLGTTPRRWAGQDAADYLADIREPDPIFTREGLGHPGLIQRVMNRVLVDNTILGPWIHVGSRMQLLSAAARRRRDHRAGKSHRELREERPPLRRARRAGARQRHDAAGALPAHRDLPAARAGGGVTTRAVMPREGGASSTPRLLDSSRAASGILDRPLLRAMTVVDAEITQPYAAFASWIARHTRSGVSGMSICLMP